MPEAPLPWLDPQADPATAFPAPVQAWGQGSDAPGLLAAGGALSPAWLQAAYRQGIFPWFSRGQPILWWSPDPRMVLPVAEFKLHRSLRKTLQRFVATPGCEIRIDHDFPAVIQACARAPRTGQRGTWIVPAMVQAYADWHHTPGPEGPHSVETWIDGQFAGGLYGVAVGRMFYGESMVAHRTDASKIALAALVAFCQARGIEWIDCQQDTAHLASLGGRTVPRAAFEAHLARATVLPAVVDWSYHERDWAEFGVRSVPEAEGGRRP